jgi:hypothetical protein
MYVSLETNLLFYRVIEIDEFSPLALSLTLTDGAGCRFGGQSSY